jgi:lipopolysaccharide/colanic/teichoic acid biosynthesis glycosyltransferase
MESKDPMSSTPPAHSVGQGEPEGPSRLRCRLDGRSTVAGLEAAVTSLEAPLRLVRHPDGWSSFDAVLGSHWGQRAIDVIASVVLLVGLAPVLAIAACAIAVTSPGPVVYRQLRVGLGGRSFTMLKFRTMRQGSERDGPRWAEENDPRVTRLGRWLRRSHLDELPQLVNVVRGDMSLVGPRPERPEFVDRLVDEIPGYHLRHVVRPGVTGWAQVNQGYAASVEATVSKLEYDLEYLRTPGLAMYLRVLLRTVWTSLLGKGSR